jgi:histidine ammonia-lyase
MRDRIRADVPFWEEDRYASADMSRVAGLVRSGALLTAVEERAGALNT